MTSPLKSMYFQIFWQKLLSQNNYSYNRQKLPNVHKLIYAIYSYIETSWYLLFSYGSHLKTTTNLIDFSDDINVSVNWNRDILKFMFTLNNI